MNGKLWNNSYAYLRSWTPDFAWSSGIYIDSFCSGWAKSRCGGVLAVDFDDFYGQHSFGFHALGTILPWFLLTLTSSTSFGNYLNPGATSANLGKNGANPRPAGLPLPHFAMKLHGGCLEPKAKSHRGGFNKIHKIEPKGLNQVKLRSKPVTTRRTRVQFNLWNNLGPENNKSVQPEPEPSQSQAGWPRRGRDKWVSRDV